MNSADAVSGSPSGSASDRASDTASSVRETTALLEIQGHPGLEGPLGQGVLRIQPGELAFLEGESGAGKTRLLRHLVDLEPGLQGDVFLAGQPVKDMPPALLRKQISLLPQDLPIHPCTGRELLAAIRIYQANRDSHLTETETGEWLELFELTPHLDKKIELLSGGEKRRLSLVASLIPRPRVLLLDEPETGLDPRRRGSLDSFVERALGESMAILWVSHLSAATLFAGAPQYRIQRSPL